MFVKVPGKDANRFSQKAMEKDLLVVPGDSFGCPGYVRLCYCGSFDKVQRSLPIFRNLMEEMGK
jgi:aspartate aminotransferase